MREYQKLKVWRDSMTLVKKIYQLTASFPEEEKFGLSSQLRRAAVSVPSNIAEGRGRESDREFVRYLYIARGSLMEIETQCHIANQLGFVGNTEDIFQRTHTLYAKLQRLIISLQPKTIRQPASDVRPQTSDRTK